MGGVHGGREIIMWWEVFMGSVIRTAVLTDFYVVFAVLCWIDLNKDCIENSVAIMSDNSNSDLELADDKNWFIFIANFRSYWIKFLCESDFSTSQDNNRVRGKVIMWSQKLQTAPGRSWGGWRCWWTAHWLCCWHPDSRRGSPGRSSRRGTRSLTLTLSTLWRILCCW